MFDVRSIAGVLICAFLAAGCVNKKLPSAELAKLQGGTTTVVAFAECAPINQLLGHKIAEGRYAVFVNGKRRARLSSCGSSRFSVPSGQHKITAEHDGPTLFRPTPIYKIFKPGATQYLFIYRDGYANVFNRWSTAAHAKQMKAAGKGIKKFW